jgi:DNA-binding NtrC family response regulator
VEWFSDRALELLASHRWPGNVRKLENLVNQAVLLSTDPEVEPEDLGGIHAPPGGTRQPDLDYDRIRSLREAVSAVTARCERDIIRHFLEKNRYNKSRTARDLSLTRKTLSEKMARYGL